MASPSPNRGISRLSTSVQSVPTRSCSASFRLPVRSIETSSPHPGQPSIKEQKVLTGQRLPSSSGNMNSHNNDWREEINREIALCEFYDRLTPLKQIAFKKMMVRMGETMPAPILHSKPVVSKRDIMRPRSPLMIPARLLRSNRGNSLSRSEQLMEPGLHAQNSSSVQSSQRHEPMFADNNITQLASESSNGKPVIYMPNFRPSEGPPDTSATSEAIPSSQTVLQRNFQAQLKAKTATLDMNNIIKQETTSEHKPPRLTFKKMKFTEAELKRACPTSDESLHTPSKIKREADESETSTRVGMIPQLRHSTINTMRRVPAAMLTGSPSCSTSVSQRIPAYMTLKHPIPPPSAAIKIPVKAMHVSRPNFKRVPTDMEIGDNNDEDEEIVKLPPEIRDTINANPFADIQPPMGSEPIENPHINHEDDGEDDLESFESPNFPGGQVEQMVGEMTPEIKIKEEPDFKEDNYMNEEEDMTMRRVFSSTRVIRGVTYYNCSHCKTLLTKSQLANHERNFSANGLCEPVRRRYQCPYMKCDEEMISMDKYCSHLHSAHKKPCVVQEKVFKNYEEYEIFRTELESVGNFRVTRGFKPAPDGASIKYFSCSRYNRKTMHGRTETENERIVFSDDEIPADLKDANPCVTKRGAVSFAKGKVCTAFYRLTTFPDGTCHVRYCDYHLHPPVVLKVPEEAKARIRELGLRLPVAVIIMIIKAEAKRFAAGGSPAYERILQIKGRDVRNILAMAKINPIKVREFNALEENYSDLQLPENLSINAEDSEDEHSTDDEERETSAEEYAVGRMNLDCSTPSYSQSEYPISESNLGVIERMKLIQWKKEIPIREADANRRRSVAYHRNMKKREIHTKFLAIAAKGQPYIVGKCTHAEMDDLDILAKQIESILDRAQKRNMTMVKQMQDAEQIEIDKKAFLTELHRKREQKMDGKADKDEKAKSVTAVVKEECESGDEEVVNKEEKKNLEEVPKPYITREVVTRTGRKVKMRQFDDS